MRNDHYPEGTAKNLLQTDLVNEQTQLVINKRLEREQTNVPLFFDTETFSILHSVCKRLIPQTVGLNKIDLAGLLDEQLASGNGNGWRYDQMPPDKEAFSKGLYGIDETSKLMFDVSFILLSETQQDEVLKSIQSGFAKGKTWEQIPCKFFFEELLASLVELYYSHPVAKDEIGEVAYADAKGWQKIGLNQLEVYEPSLIKKIVDDK